MINNEDDLFDYNRPHNPTPDGGLRYNRAERLKRASENVQHLHDGSFTKRPGVLKGLLAVKSYRYMFLVILLMIFILGIFYFLPQNTGTINDMKLKLTCQATSTAVFANLLLTPSIDFNKKESQNLIIAFTAFDKEGNALETKRLETICIGQKLLLSVDFKLFNIKKIQAYILTDEKDISLVYGL